MDDLHAALKNLQLTLQKLLKNYTNLKKENDNLKKVNLEMHKVLAEKEDIIKQIEQKMAAGNIKNLYNEEQKQLLNSKINYYLKDIQKCLDLLNS